METNVLKVKLWEHTVGYTYWDKKLDCGVFEYEPEFLKLGLDISPLSLSIYANRSLKLQPWLGIKEKLYQGLPPLLADSLPDKWGNSLFKSWIRDNKISMRNITPIDHLAFIGSRAMGALEFEPAQELGDNSAFEVDVQILYHFAKKVLDERENVILNTENSILWQDLVKISSSPGGKRPKAIVAINDKTNQIISGQGIIPKGFQHFILKYDDNSAYPFAKLEYIYYKMALDSGIEMMPSELRTFGNVSHFLTRRFDRIDNERVHIQTLAAMLPWTNSYNELFDVMRQLKLPYHDFEQQFIRMVFNVVFRNVDNHNKNISFSMDKLGKWRLSPAYDLTYSVDQNTPNFLNRHEMSINGKTDSFLREDLVNFAVENEIRDYNSLINNTLNVRDNFNKYANELNIQNQLVQSIQSDFKLL